MLGTHLYALASVWGNIGVFSSRITVDLLFLPPDYSNYTLKMINEEEFGRGSAFRRLEGTV